MYTYVLQRYICLYINKYIWNNSIHTYIYIPLLYVYVKKLTNDWNPVNEQVFMLLRYILPTYIWLCRCCWDNHQFSVPMLLGNNNFLELTLSSCQIHGFSVSTRVEDYFFHLFLPISKKNLSGKICLRNPPEDFVPWLQALLSLLLNQ